MRETRPDLDRSAPSAATAKLIGPGVIESAAPRISRSSRCTARRGEKQENCRRVWIFGVPYTGNELSRQRAAPWIRGEQDPFPQQLKHPYASGVTLRRGDARAGEHRLSVRREALLQRLSSVGTSIVTEPEKLPGALEEAFSCDEAVLCGRSISAPAS